MLPWCRGDVAKNRIPQIVRPPLVALPTSFLSQRSVERAPVPGVAKPNRGSCGKGLVKYRTRAALASFTLRAPKGYVVQPLVVGTEYRITLCADGTFAAALLLARRGMKACYVDVGPPRWILPPLAEILEVLGVPGAGFDLIGSKREFWLLDINLSPSFAVHSRDLVSAYLASWMDTP